VPEVSEDAIIDAILEGNLGQLQRWGRQGVRVRTALAAFLGHDDTVRYLVKELRADVNIPDNKGVTPLYFAASMGYLDVVRILLKLGADINRRKNDGITPLLMA
jgi:hypothetical protein